MAVFGKITKGIRWQAILHILPGPVGEHLGEPILQFPYFNLFMGTQSNSIYLCNYIAVQHLDALAVGADAFDAREGWLLRRWRHCPR